LRAQILQTLLPRKWRDRLAQLSLWNAQIN